MRNERKKLKEKSFSFFADAEKTVKENPRTLHTFANHTSRPANQNLQKSAIIPTLFSFSGNKTVKFEF